MEVDGPTVEAMPSRTATTMLEVTDLDVASAVDGHRVAVLAGPREHLRGHRATPDGLAALAAGAREAAGQARRDGAPVATKAGLERPTAPAVDTVAEVDGPPEVLVVATEVAADGLPVVPVDGRAGKPWQSTSPVFL